MEVLLDEDCFQIQEELTEYLRVTQEAIWKSLKEAGYQQQGTW